MIERVCASTDYGQDTAVWLVVPAAIQSILKSYCESLQGAYSVEGYVRFEIIMKLDAEGRLKLLNRLQTQRSFGLMDSKDVNQPSEAGCAQLVDWSPGNFWNRNVSGLDENCSNWTTVPVPDQQRV